MQGTETDQRIGLEALRAGDMQRAREYLSRAVTGGRTDAATLLALEPRNIRALLIKADHLAAAADSRSAASFYLAALRSAPPANQVPADLVPDLRRAQEASERYAAEYQAYLLERLRAQGFDARTSSQRFAQSLDIVLGRRQVYVQEPRSYYFPGLPQIQFYDRALFPW